MTVEEILADLGATVDPAKAANVAKWNTTLATTESGAAQKLAAAEKQLKDAQDLQRVIDDNIAKAGLTETNIAQLQANNAALTAALASRDAAIKSIKDQGFTGINIPELPALATPPAKDPMKELTDKLMGGFAAMGQTMNETAATSACSVRRCRKTRPPSPTGRSPLASRPCATTWSTPTRWARKSAPSPQKRSRSGSMPTPRPRSKSTRLNIRLPPGTLSLALAFCRTSRYPQALRCGGRGKVGPECRRWKRFARHATA